MKNRVCAVLLSGILWIVELCCPEIQYLRGQKLHRSFFYVTIIYL